MPIIATLVSSLFLAVVLIPYLMRHAVALGLVDRPNERKVHVSAVPRVGGIAIVIAFLTPFAMWFPKNHEFLGIVGGVILLFLFGVWDDRRDLNYRLKFAGQLLASLLVVGLGDIRIETVPFLAQPLPEVVSWLLTLFCLLAITNAMNLADGLDGLAGGASILSFGLVGLLAYQSGSYALMLCTLAVAGGILGFLRFNSHPARIFMGDTGSQFLGFILGIQVILLTQKVNTALSPVLPLLILGLPVIDTASVMIIRLLQRRSPFSPDKNHVHHRLLQLGFTHYETVVLLYFIQSGFLLLAYLLRFHMDMVVLGAFALYSCLILVGLQQALRYDVVRCYGSGLASPGRLSALLSHSVWAKRSINPLLQVSLFLLLPCYSLHALLDSAFLATDVGLLALMLALLLTINLFYSTRKTWLDAIGMYTFCALIAYLGYNAGHRDFFVVLEWVSVILLGICVWLAVSMHGHRRFETSPLDVLVILLALLVPLLAGQLESGNHILLAVVKFVVLLYAFEYIRHGEQPGLLNSVRGVVTLCLLGLGIGGIFFKL